MMVLSMVTGINNMGDKKVRKKFSLLLIVVLEFMMVSCSTFPQRKKYENFKKYMRSHGWSEVNYNPDFSDIIETVYYLVYQEPLKRGVISCHYYEVDNVTLRLIHDASRPNDPNFMLWFYIMYEGKRHYFMKINYMLEVVDTYTSDLYDINGNFIREETRKIFY
ncbi:hypothetical protein [Treponema denticola]|uniref:hypothetical protein n=1 Tax=Treponema denticola TaxID=158 RepID=UPI0005D1520B|nr:hypothetical protein [Treponema denticola]